ncbi:MAG TPA: hypothetical protein VFC19_19820 [Candidatus Limnocylindrales bacterium]|nr:hypothetical protein [Candidatus Limnocylindrales bacterium]
MHLLISVITNDWTRYHHAAEALKPHILASATPLVFAHPEIFHRSRGFLLLVDWDREHIVATRPFAKPFGFALEDGHLHVATWGDEEVLTLQGDKIVQRISHPWLNHLHSVATSDRGLLVTSSGTDLIAEFGPDGTPLWMFLLFENGYPGRPYPLGIHFQHDADYRHRYIPSALAMHVNSALPLPDGSVLATVFRSGELIRIDRVSGQIHRVLTGLHHPHAVRPAPAGYSVCDTEGRNVVLLDHSLHTTARLTVPVPWIQDAFLTGEHLFIVGNRRMPTATASPSPDPTELTGILEFSASGALLRRLHLPQRYRPFMAAPIGTDQSDQLATAWRSHLPDLPDVHWSTAQAT